MTSDINAWTDAEWARLGIHNPDKPSNISIVIDMLAETREVPGDIVECGIFQGASLAAMAAVLKRMDSRKGLWGFDSFQGLPAPVAADKRDGADVPKGAAGYFADTSQPAVQAKIDAVGYKPVHLVAGWFQDTIERAPSPLSLVFLDCDFYESYRTTLAALWPRLSPGGVMIFDEYFSKKYPGARKAIDEYFLDKPDKPVLAKKYLADNAFERWYARKSPDTRSS